MEQELIENLVMESIRIHGLDMYYLPRTTTAVDDLLNEDDLSEFTSFYNVEMYVKSVDGFEGEGDFLSKFGLQIRDSMVLTVAIRTFEEEVGRYAQLVRPNEGDLIYLPINRKLFKIMHVQHEAIFYQMGALQTYDLRCDLFEYSNERFSTGLPELDNLYSKYVSTSNAAISNVETVDLVADNQTIETEAAALIDFNVDNPFGDETY